ELLDEIFGSDNFVSIISYSVSSGMGANLLPRENDFLIWYCKSITKIKYRQIYQEKQFEGEGAGAYRQIELPNGKIRPIDVSDIDENTKVVLTGKVLRFGDVTKPGPGQKYEVDVSGCIFDSGSRWWGLPPDALRRAIRARRVIPSGRSLVVKRYL